MSAVLVIGESGSGKTASIRNLEPAKTLILQLVDKELPFPDAKKNFRPWDADKKQGEVIVVNSALAILAILEKAPSYGKEVIIIDDFQYLMSFEFMARAKEKGYDKFTEIASNAYNVIMAAKKAKANVYIFTHLEDMDSGKQRMKTIGKLLNEKITPEGLFTIVLKSVVTDEGYFFSTKNNNDTVKTPMEMFKEPLIPNDLAEVDKTINNYYK